MKTKIIILIVLIAVLQVNAEIRFVSKSGSSLAPYTSWLTAADRIQKAINICNPGDTVYVANGIYQDTVRMRPGIALIGSGMDSCIIDSRDFLREQMLVTITMHDSCLVKGFHILCSRSNDASNSRIGINPPRDVLPNIYNKCAIEFNKIEGPNIGIGLNQINGTVRNNTITNCTDCIELWPLLDSVSLRIENNLLFNFESGIRLAYGSFDLIGNIIILERYRSISGVIGGAGGTCRLYNNLVIAKKNDNWRGFQNTTAATYMYNNLMYGDFTLGNANLYENHVAINNLIVNSSDGFRILLNSKPTMKYNNAWNVKYPYIGFTPDTTNKFYDPMFANEDSLNFHLQLFSPLIHAGDPDIKNVDGTRSDIGLFGGPYGESYTYQDIAPRPPVNLTGQIVNKIIKIGWNKNSESDFSYYNVYKDTVANFTPGFSKIIAKIKDTTFSYFDSTNKPLYFKLTAVDTQGNESGSSEEISVNITGIINDIPSPADFQLYQNYPNPFNPSTIISYRLKERGFVKLRVYDITGKLIAALENGVKEAGYHETEFTGNSKNYTGLASGIYVYKLGIYKNNIPVFTDSKKMLFLK